MTHHTRSTGGVAVSVEVLGKRYRLGASVGGFRTLRDSIAETVSDTVGRLRGSRAPRAEERPWFWALQDVSFEVPHGVVMGIVGRNGAGKSTLLKLLSRITEPTTGRVELHGRVGSLLEVGTGFHPELSGRENIFLSSAILGMSRADCRRKFDEIVAFAEIERFIDTPVKRYSSGMYTRLAFAVAAHLEPEILLIDEVLAVGDVEFQKKCLGKVGEVAREGRTVLFVSHQMNAIQSLCTDCIWLDQGRVVEKGDARYIIAKYTRASSMEGEWRATDSARIQSPYFQPLRLALVDHELQPLSRAVQADESVGVVLEGVVEQLNPATTVGFAVYAQTGELLFWTYHTDVAEDRWPPIRVGNNRLVGWLPPHLLNEGEYRIELIASLHFQSWICQPGVNAPSIRLTVQGGLSESPYWMMVRPGLLAPHIRFEALDADAGTPPVLERSAPPSERRQ